MNSQSTTILPPATTLVRADKYLHGPIIAWFVVAVIGQLLFAAYVAGFYGGTALSGDIARWNDELQHGYREGETMSNLAVGTHLLFAVGRKMRQHEHWAVRLFLVASGVWLFRVMLMVWLVVLGPVGIDPETFTGPLLDVLGYAHYLLPLAIYELYLWAKQRSSAPGRYAMTGLMIVCTLLTAIGVFGATMGMWLPAFTG